MIAAQTRIFPIAFSIHIGERNLAEQMQRFLSQTCLPYDLVVGARLPFRNHLPLVPHNSGLSTIIQLACFN
jgi:hypothetical protein